MPFFSICVPQYNRTSFLIKALEALKNQDFRDFEVCISDGGSTDGRITELEAWLKQSGLAYSFAKSDVNLRYDANTRSAIGLAKGRYVVLMGNDDAFNGLDALSRLHDDISGFGYPGVIISDFCDDATNDKANRITETRLFNEGAATAATHFRNFSFVSGLTMDTECCHKFVSDKWDGSEMYQTFVGCQTIASGRTLLERDHVLVRKDLVVAGEAVDSYATRNRLSPCRIQERPLPLQKLGLVVCDAIKPYTFEDRRMLNEKVLNQLIGYTYPFWLFEYRRVQSWNFAVGIALAMRPSRTANGVCLGWWRRLRVHLRYQLVTVCGLVLPISLFDRFRSVLYRIAKSEKV